LAGTGAKQALGRSGEDAALEYLIGKKYAIVETRYRRHRGEIDIIARDGATFVFVEVKTRTSAAYGRPEEAVTPAKQQQIRRVAQGYLFERRLGSPLCRFDVLAVRRGDDGEFCIEHFRNAF
jgi:putative endonuclease